MYSKEDLSVRCADPPPQAVREQLERILKSEDFSNAPILSRFLRYLVERFLQGDESRLKEYTLGLEVFARKADFDPRFDTIVRVQARRLRARLDGYYQGRGWADPIVLTVPKGSYVPRIHLPNHDARPTALAPDSAASLRPNYPKPLPAPRTRFIGRKRELADIVKLVRNDSARLITLTGVGGSGKTRLSLQAAAHLSNDFSGGIYFAALSSCADLETVAATIAQVLGIRRTGSMPLPEAIEEYLQLVVHTPTLLLLDNFEQVVEAAPLLGRFLDVCSSLKILVTSRAVLHIYGEHEYPVPPLPTPDADANRSLSELRRNPAVLLFVERARAVLPGFALTEDNARHIALICARLEGLPLSIELAASRIKLLRPKTLLARLESRLNVLANSACDAPDRHRTLRKTLDWSYRLLDEAEQKLLRRLSVFVGGCTLESAEAVCNTKRDLGVELPDGISSLVDNSLVQQVESEERQPRFVLLETVREYGLELLAASGEEEATRKAHAAYCLVLAEESQGAFAMELIPWLALCDAEYENLREAVNWLTAREEGEWALRLGLALYWFWETREHLVEGRNRIDAILNMKTTRGRTRERAKLLGRAASLRTSLCDFPGGLQLHRDSLDLYRELGDTQGMAAQLTALGANEVILGNVASARAYFEQCLSLCRERDDPSAIASTLSNLAEVVNAQGDHAEASLLLEEALTIFRELGEWSGVGWALNHFGDISRDRGNPSEASEFYEEGRKVFQRLGDRWGLGRSFADLGYLACEQGDYARARSLFNEALEIFLSLEHRRGIAKVLDGFACLAVQQKDSLRALTLAGAAAALRDSIKTRARPVEKAKFDRMLAPAWQSHDRATAEAAWKSGWKMSIDDVVQRTLD